LEKILIETDCPYLTPHPHRGKRNEPAYVKLVAQEVARIKGLSLVEIARITSGNAQALFALKL
jgi:TatD DNase family protein